MKRMTDPRDDLLAYRDGHPTFDVVRKGYDREQVAEVGQAAYDVHRNLHQGKVGVLTLAPEAGLGVKDQAKREQHLAAINRFRDQ